MRFVLNMAWRELRASWHRLLFFFICIAIGVGSIVALRSLLQNLRASLVGQSRALLTADLQVSAGANWNDETRAVLERIYASPLVEAHTETVELATMSRAVKNPEATPKMVELKAVGPEFPFYGELLLADGVKYSPQLLAHRGLLAKQNLLTALDLQVGDAVRIGNAEFTIRGVIESEPGNTMNAFSFGPRVIISRDDAVAAGLTGFGTRARYRALFKTREADIDQVVAQLRSELKNQPGVLVRSFRYSQDRLSESLGQVEDYLSLIGLVILVLGGIGVSSVTSVFIQQKIKTVAILKTLGGRNAPVVSAYLAQIFALGLLGSLVGLALAQLAIATLPKYFAANLPLNLSLNLTWQAALQGVSLGLLISLLFSLVPLLEVRRIKPSLVLRSLTDTERHRFDWVRAAAIVVVVAGLIGLASWQAGSLRVGLIFLGGLAAMTLVLNAAAWALMRFLRTFRRIPSFAVRQGISSLYRQGNQTRTILLAIGLGVFFIVSVRSLQLNLRREFTIDLNSIKADMYLIDIQRDQRAGVERTLEKFIGAKPEIIPTVRARIAAINNQTVTLDRAVAEERGQQGRSGGPQANNAGNSGLLSREYVLTYRPTLDDNETIIAGKFWDATPTPPGGEAEISIEELLHDDLKLKLGDLLTFDIQGRKITARVTNVRRVDWRNARTGFLILFRPGALEAAPTMFISAIKGPAASADRARMQREIVEQFSNVSVIDLRDVIETARGIVRNISLAVSFVGGFVFLSGLLILIGSIAMTKFHRLYESAILKTLGAKRKLIVATLLVEYGVLGLLAGLLGSVAAIALTWAVSKHALRITWHLTPLVNLLGIVASVALVMLVGVLASWDVLLRKPLGVLRAE